jgi:hypothetical protein
MQATRQARRDSRLIYGGNRTMTAFKRQIRRRNRRAVRQAIRVGKDTDTVERRVTAWDIG